MTEHSSQHVNLYTWEGLSKFCALRALGCKNYSLVSMPSSARPGLSPTDIRTCFRAGATDTAMVRQRAGLAAASLGILCPLAWQPPHWEFCALRAGGQKSMGTISPIRNSPPHVSQRSSTHMYAKRSAYRKSSSKHAFNMDHILVAK